MLQLDRLAKQLRARRFAEGAIGFEREEVKFVLDEKGKPTDVYFKVSKDANKLIEEFMLLANRTVAEAIGKDVRPQRINGKMQKKAKSFVYRIHDQPSQEKLESLATLAARFGHNVKSIFSGKKSDVVDHTKNNPAGIEATERFLKDGTGDFIFTNLVDTDMLYGHRNDVEGYAEALEYFDRKLPDLMAGLGEGDILIVDEKAERY